MSGMVPTVADAGMEIGGLADPGVQVDPWRVVGDAHQFLPPQTAVSGGRLSDS